jgi:hypothetical protein
MVNPASLNRSIHARISRLAPCASLATYPSPLVMKKLALARKATTTVGFIPAAAIPGPVKEFHSL